MSKLLQRLLEEVNGAGNDLGGAAGTPATPAAPTEDLNSPSSLDSTKGEIQDLSSLIDFSDDDAGLVDEESEVVAPTPNPAQGVPSSTPAAGKPGSEVAATPVSPEASSASPTPAAPVPGTPAEPTQPQAPAAGTPETPPTETPPFDAAKWESERLQSLEKQYAISDEDAVTMVSNPEQVLPKILANIHHAVMKETVSAIMQALPGQIQHITQQQVNASQAESQFFGMFPDLRGKTEEVLRATNIVRTLNPQARGEQAMRLIGNMVRLSLGLPVSDVAPAAPAPNAAAAPAAPTAPAAPVAPFRPAGAFGVGAPVTPDDNPFARLSMDDDDD